MAVHPCSLLGTPGVERWLAVVAHGGGGVPFGADHPLSMFCRVTLGCGQVLAVTLPFCGKQPLSVAERTFLSASTDEPLEDRLGLVHKGLLAELLRYVRRKKVVFIGYSLGSLTLLYLRGELSRALETAVWVNIGSGLCVGKAAPVIAKFWTVEGMQQKMPMYQKMHHPEKIVPMINFTREVTSNAPPRCSCRR